MKPLPIGIQTFSEIINLNMVYVDKTDLIYKMVKPQKYFFLSCPRRFGKSLLISTLQAYFEGRKELFKGLKIEQLEKDWTEYPVVNLSFAKCKSKQLDVIVKFVSIGGINLSSNPPSCQQKQECPRQNPNVIQGVGNIIRQGSITIGFRY